MSDLLVSLSRERPNGDVEYLAHTADPHVVAATLAALDSVLRRPQCDCGPPDAANTEAVDGDAVVEPTE